MIILDLETKGLGGSIVIGGVYDGLNYFEFKNMEKALDLLNVLTIGKTETIYAHNGGKYDNRYIFEYAIKAGLKITSIMPIQNGLVFNLHYKNKIFKFKDSIHLLPRSLKELSISFGVDNGKKDFDLKKWIKAGYPITKELKEYLKYDCIALYEVLIKFQESTDATLKDTIASTSFNHLLQYNYKGEKLQDLLCNYQTKAVENNIRLAYKGGRVEVFNRLGKNLFKYDVNSLYPYAMWKYDYPYGKHAHYTDKKDIERKLQFKRLGVLRCTIEINEMEYPYLAKRHDKKLMFPVGKWEDWITSFEYEEALKRGYKIEIHEGYFWNKKGRLFKEFVTDNYELKRNSTGAKKEVAKLFLNSAYGKFGQRRTKKIIKTEQELLNQGVDMDSYLYLNRDLGILQKEVESYQNRKINPIIAVFVTAYARHELYLGMEHIFKQPNGIVYYVDTDCIVANKPLPENLIHPDNLGAWDKEHKDRVYDEGVFVAPKLYALIKPEEEILKLKGVSKEIQKHLCYQDIINLLYGEGIEYEHERLTGVFEQHKLKGTDKKKMIERILRNKKITNEYNKRELLEDKIHTKPIRI